MKLRWNRLLVFPLIISILGLWLLWPHSKPSAEWYNEGWLYRKKITVTNNTSTESNKYVTLSSFDTSDTTRFQADCGDVRFIKQNGEILPYYVVSGCGTASTTFHINFDSLVAGAQDIYIYYGNPSVADGFQTTDFSSAATNATVGSPATEENTPGPVSYWKFDEGADNTCSGGTNDACDATPQQNDLALSGATWKAADSCVAGNCLYFDGSNDSVSKAGGTGGNAAQFVQECSNSGTNVSGGTNLNVTCSTTGGNLVVVMIEANTGPTRSFSVSDSAGNTYTECTSCRHQTSGVQNTGELWYSLTTSSAVSIGVSATGSTSMSVSAVEVSGIMASPFDQYAMNFNDANTTNNPDSGSSPSTSQAYEVAIGYIGITANTTLSGSTSGWTYNTTQSGSATSIKSGYNILSTAQAVSIGGTAGTNQRWTSALGTFKANTAVGGDPELDPGTGSFTISSWFKHPTTITGTNTIISRADGVNGVGYKLYMNSSGYVCFGIDQTAGSFPVDSACTTISYADNLWHHIAGVKTGTSNITLYIDGQQVAQDSSITSSSITGTASPMKVGIDADGTSNPWDGFIDEVKYYNFARTAAQIKSDAVRPNGQAGKGNSAVLGQGSNDFLTKGLIGYWKMDESAADTCTGGSNDSCDASGNLNDGAWTNGATSTTVAKFGNAASFDGTNDTIQVADSDSLSPSDMTISSWIKMTALPSATGQDQMILRKSHSTSPFNAVHWYVRQADNKLRFEWYDSTGASNNLTGSTALTAGTWYHVAVSKNGTSAKIFINGVEDASSNSFTLSTYNSTGPLRIGSNGSSANFYGQIDDVRMYNRGLEPREVSALYNWGPGPVGNWKFDENTGTTAYDTSGSGNNATLRVSTSWNPGKFGSSALFDGVNGSSVLLTNDSLDSLTQGTIEFWMKAKDSGDSTQGLFSGGNGTNAYELYYETSTNAVNIWTSGCSTNIRGSAVLPGSPTDWHHVVYSVDSSGNKLYFDGKQVTVSYTTGNATISCFYNNNITSGTTSYYIGCTDNSPPNCDNTTMYEGNIDNVSVYNYARTPAQIIEDMNGGHPLGGSPVGSQVAYWKFDEGALNTCANGTDDFCDSSINANDLAFSGTAGGITLSGKFNKAFDGNGARWASRADDNDFDFAAADDFTISAWIKTDGTASGTQYILNKSSATSQGYGIYGTSSGKVVFAIDDDTSWTPDDQVQSTTNVYDQAWHYIAARKTGTSKIDIFVDGRLEASKTSLGATGSLSNAVSLYIGDRDGTDNGDEFNGDIDELKIYRAALTDDQIKLDYNRGSSVVLGSSSTASNGTTADNSASQEFCVPGDTSTCSPPIGEWKFDENSGTTSINDTSGNNLTGTINGSMTQSNWMPGKHGSALNFDGTDDYIEVTDNGSLSPSSAITVSAWAKFNQLSSTKGESQRIVRKVCAGGVCADNSSYILEFNNSTDNIRFSVHLGGSLVYVRTANNSIVPNTWYFLTGVYDSATGSLKVYVNGTDQTAFQSGAASGSIQGDTSALRIGAHTSSASRTDGIIDNVRIYNYARTPAQISWMYNHDSPVIHYKFDECSGTTAYNSVINGNGQAAGNNGTITIGATGANTSAGTCTGASTEAWKNGANGKFGSSLDFDGTDDYITTSATTLSAGVGVTYPSSSWGGWFYPKTSAASKTLIEKATEFRITTDASSNAICGIYYSGAFHDATSVTAPLTLNSWNHVMCTTDGTNIKTYLNGRLVNITADSHSIISTSSVLYIAENSSSTQRFKGQIDELSIYDFPLTPAQIKTVYNRNATVLYAPITGSP